ncbi:MAG: hemerythrin domain-containing protein [Candidatus Methylomirabilales bacterium]
MSQAASFLSLLQIHERLRERFLLHQERLLARDLPGAREQLRDFDGTLVAHIRSEEDDLLPVYARAGAIPGGPAALFTGEHRKMREFVERFKRMLDWVEEHPDEQVRGILRTFDEQATFKHLLAHHDQREANILYPALDRVTTEAERAALLARCR